MGLVEFTAFSSIPVARAGENAHPNCARRAPNNRGRCAAIQVQYRQMYPSFHLDDGKDLSPLYTKSFHWQYEEEYRLIVQEESSAFRVDTLITRNQLYRLPCWLIDV